MKLTLKEITEEKGWDDFIKENESGHLFQSFDWGRFKENQKTWPKWKVYRTILQDSTGRNRAALSILEKKIPLVGFKIWYIPRGPVLDYRNRELVEETVDSLIDFARKSKIIALKINPDVVLNENTKWIVTIFKNKGFKETDHYELHKCTVRIDIKDAFNNIFERFKKNTRWEIRKEEKDSLVNIKDIEQIIIDEGPKNELKWFYRIYSDYAETMGTDRLPYSYFENLWDVFRENILLPIAFYEIQGEKHRVSMALILHFNKKCYYLFGGSRKKFGTSKKEYSYRYANQYLQSEVIRRAKIKWNSEVYDLQGIPCGEPKTPHDKGILQFKEGFGGERVELIGEFDYIFSPVLFKFLSKILYPMFLKLNQARIMMRGMTGRV